MERSRRLIVHAALDELANVGYRVRRRVDVDRALGDSNCSSRSQSPAAFRLTSEGGSALERDHRREP